MCPHRAASLFTLTSSRRFSPVAYRQKAVYEVVNARNLKQSALDRSNRTKAQDEVVMAARLLNLSHNAVRYRTVFRIAKSDSRFPSSAEEASGLRRLKLVWSQPMVTIAILGSVAVGGLLAATGYRICRNEILALTNRRPNWRLLLSTGSATGE